MSIQSISVLRDNAMRQLEHLGEQLLAGGRLDPGQASCVFALAAIHGAACTSMDSLRKDRHVHHVIELLREANIKLLALDPHMPADFESKKLVMNAIGQALNELEGC